ncbi:hypothetical protein NSQ91_13995 [Paenibacillus sp. FSL R7-0048]|uniref:hypothetical protein n=1 Tax=Paenibacillus sp. FSL R7-0048 TaxID=2954528 RepID=UPI0030F6EF7C
MIEQAKKDIDYIIWVDRESGTRDFTTPELKEYVAGQNRLKKATAVLLAELEKAREDISAALYEMENLEKLLPIPERGYVRTRWNSVLKTLKYGFIPKESTSD